MRRVRFLSLPVLLGLLVGRSLSGPDAEPPSVSAAGQRATAATRRAPVPTMVSAPARVAAPIVPARPSAHGGPGPGEVEAILERFDAEGPLALAPEEELALRRALEDPEAEWALRAGALRVLAAARGAALLPALVELYPREDAAPLRPLIAAAVARGAGPGDGPLLEALVAAGEAARDPAGLVLALRAAVSAARRDPEDQPVRIDAALEDRVALALAGLVRSGSPARPRRDALEGLAELGGPAALRALEELERSASDPEDRLDAGTLRAALAR